MKYPSLCATLFIVLVTIYGSGCLSTDSGEAVNTTVTDFINAVNEGDYGMAYAMYEGKDFLVPASIEMAFKNKGLKKNTLRGMTFLDQNITESMAVVTVECTIAEIDITGVGREIGQIQVPVHFRLQNTDVGWIVTKVSFTEPIVLSEDDMIDIEVEKTAIDLLADNAPIIFIAAILMFGSGIYLDRKEKAAKAKPVKNVDLTGAVAIQKESIAQYVKFVPSQNPAVGKKATIDVWVKNFAQQPYENFAVTGTFPNTLEVKDANLFFGTIAPGESVKQTWVVKLKVEGWTSIIEPTAVFEFDGVKYMGVLDPVWIQVQ
jgi:hypothetical protein